MSYKRSDIDDLYESLILPHYESPQHRGHLENPTHAHSGSNPICGDSVRLEILVDSTGRINKAAFDGRGCVISQAAASVLCEHVEGQAIQALECFAAQDMLDLLKVPLVPRRQQCGLLAFRVLKTLLYFLHRPAVPVRAGSMETASGP